MADRIRDFESPLPQVTPDDILDASLEFLTNTPTHNQWRVFAKEQPDLAREILVRAHQLKGSELENTQQEVIDITAFVASAFRLAATRTFHKTE